MLHFAAVMSGLRCGARLLLALSLCQPPSPCVQCLQHVKAVAVLRCCVLQTTWATMWATSQVPGPFSKALLSTCACKLGCVPLTCLPARQQLPASSRFEVSPQLVVQAWVQTCSAPSQSPPAQR